MTGQVDEGLVLPVIAVQLAEFQLGFFDRQGQRVDTRLEVDAEAGVRIDDLSTGIVAGGVGVFFDIGPAFPGALEQPDGDFAEGGARGSDFVGGEDLFEGEIAEFMELGDVVVAEGIRANRACRLYLAHRFVAVGFNTSAL